LDFTTQPPGFLIDTQAETGAAYPMADFPYLAKLIAGHYRRISRLRDGDVYQHCELSAVSCSDCPVTRIFP
jgi:hypothetical protein